MTAAVRFCSLHQLNFLGYSRVAVGREVCARKELPKCAVKESGITKVKELSKTFTMIVLGLSNFSCSFLFKKS
jgi:hypothetical protein